MKTRILIPTLVLLLAAAPAQAACYADYKAKKDDPLRLHYGVIELPDGVCGDTDRAAEQIRQRISGAGWTLLTVLSTFGPEGLDGKKDSAGEYFLRF